MAGVAARLRAFLSDALHWVDLLSDVPARNVLRHDTKHPVFHGCIDWHSACHGVWSLIAHRGVTGDGRHAETVDRILEPSGLIREAEDLAARPEFEMPYGRAWFLRLALEDRKVTGSDRLAIMAAEVARSLVLHYHAQPADPFAREYANPSWALLNLMDYGASSNRHELAAFVRKQAEGMAPALDRLPAAEIEAAWPDFMAVTAALCELLVRSGAVNAEIVLRKASAQMLRLHPVEKPERAHHHALNFSRAWSLFSVFESSDDERFLALALDHLETGLRHPSWWRGDYRAVAHWVPQFGIFALQRAIETGRRKGFNP